MDFERLKSLSEQDRKAVLESESVAVEEGRYTKPLSNEELAFFKDQLAENSINQAVILDEFQTVKETYKDKLEPIKKNISYALSAIKYKAIEQDGRLYKIADYDTKMIHKVDELGNVITSRQMLPEERQHHINEMRTIGTLNIKSA